MNQNGCIDGCVGGCVRVCDVRVGTIAEGSGEGCGARRGICGGEGARVGGWAGGLHAYKIASQISRVPVRMRMCVCVCAHVCVCIQVCVHV